MGSTSEYLEIEHSTTARRMLRRGRAYLRRQRRVRGGEFSVEGWTGWRPGQLLTISDDVLGVSGTYEVKEVSGELAAGAPVVYTVRYGAPRKSLLRAIRRRD